MDRETPTPPPANRQARAFKAVIVLTSNDGNDPTLAQVDQALRMAGLVSFAMPASVEGPIVISLSL